MGHNTHIEFIPALADEVLTAEQLVERAVRIWSDEEADRYDSPRVGRIRRVDPHARQAAERNVNAIADWRVNDDRTLVVPVVADEDTIVAEQELTVTVTGNQLQQLRVSPRWAALERARSEVGSMVEDAEVVRLPKPVKPRARHTLGAMVTQYLVVEGDGRKLSGPHATMPEARQAGLDLLEQQPQRSRLEVRAEVLRQDAGPALAVIERSAPDTAKVTLRVTTRMPKHGAPIAGHLVAFDYHS